MRLKIAHTFFLVLFAFCKISFAAKFSGHHIDRFIQEAGGGFVFGLEIRDAASGRVLFQRHGTQLMKPASLQKIPASLVALKNLGASYQFVTTVGQKGLDVCLHFTGDPTFRLSHLVDLFAAYKEKKGGILRGNILINREAYPAFPYGDGWSVDSVRFLYGAIISNIVINNNGVCARVIPPKFYGNKANVIYDADQPPYPLINNVVSGKCTAHTSMQRRDCQFDGAVRVQGCVSLGSNPFRVCLPLAPHQFEDYIRHAVKTALKKAGIKFSGKIIFKPFQKYTFKEVAVHRSARFSEMLKLGMKDSKNGVMEAFMVPLAMQKRHYFRKETALEEFLKGGLKKLLGVDLTKACLVDMSGLSHHNLITPQQLGEILWQASRRMKDFSLWKETFALGGEDGTVSKRLKKTGKGVKIYAKTGALLGVSNIAGYVEKNNKPVFSFVFMMQNFTGESRIYKDLQEKIIYYLLGVT